MEQGDRECLNGLGIMYRDGFISGVKADMTATLTHFNAAIGQEFAEAQVNIVLLSNNLLILLSRKSMIFSYPFSDRRELALATTYFKTAIRNGSPFEAYICLLLSQSTSVSQLSGSTSERPNIIPCFYSHKLLI